MYFAVNIYIYNCGIIVLNIIFVSDDRATLHHGDNDMQELQTVCHYFAKMSIDNILFYNYRGQLCNAVTRSIKKCYVCDVMGKEDEDICILQHPNGICIVCLAPTHP
ncbi:Uncharacterized protein T11_16524, partial [Trichinella zimbabwensis]